MYSPDVISDVRHLNDIVQVVASYVKLTPRSRTHFGLCPFHGEKTPSFSVNAEMQIFHCFGCGAGGDVFRFIMLYEKIDFVEALKHLADRVNYSLPEKKFSPKERKTADERKIAENLTKQAARFFFDYLDAKNEEAGACRAYLAKRGISEKIRKRFGLGLSPNSWDALLSHMSGTTPEELVQSGLATSNEKNPGHFYDRFRGRLMFPIIDTRNRVVGFGGRALSDSEQVKYINTPETALFKKKEILYGFNLAKRTHDGEIIVVEGYMDVIAMHLHGFVSTVGVLGTALTSSHVRLLKNAGVKTAVLLLDNDAAGLSAVQRAIPILSEGDMQIKVLQLEGAKDPDEYLSKFGAENFAKQLKRAKSHIAFQVGITLKKYDIKTTEGKIGFTGEASKILGTLKSSIEVDGYAKEIADISGISLAAIKQEVAKNITAESEKVFAKPRQKAKRVPAADAAKKGLAHLLLTYPKAAMALQKSLVFSSEELDGDFLLKTAIMSSNEGKRLTPAEIMDLAPDDEIKNLIAEIFVSPPIYANDKSVQKALNDYAKKIKREFLLEKLEQSKLEIVKLELEKPELKKPELTKLETEAVKPIHEEIARLAKTDILL